jgi:putative Ca2+/H+ antiporter (TMEM165/GDT1 family)
MDWKLFATTFGSVFIAEMGDKTQLATMSLSATGSRWVVLAGSICALALSSCLAVLVGGTIAKIVPPVWINRAAGVVFVVLGALMLWKSFKGEPG